MSKDKQVAKSCAHEFGLEHRSTLIRPYIPPVPVPRPSTDGIAKRQGFIRPPCLVGTPVHVRVMDLAAWLHKLVAPRVGIPWIAMRQCMFKPVLVHGCTTARHCASQAQCNSRRHPQTALLRQSQTRLFEQTWLNPFPLPRR